MKEEPFHLIIIGGGSAAFSAAHRALQLGARVTLFNYGLPLGGTCPNVGCVPSKAMIRGAEAFHRGNQTPFAGMQTQSQLHSFSALVQQRKDLVKDLVKANYIDVIPELENLEVIHEHAALNGPRSVVSASGEIQGDAILIATGSSPSIPPVKGLSEVPYLTSTEAFELEELPGSMLVIGGGYIALECAQMFSRLGSKLTVLQRSGHILSHLEPQVGQTLENYLRDEGLDVFCSSKIDHVEMDGQEVVVFSRHGNGELVEHRAETLLVAAGRTPNTSSLALEKAGIQAGPSGEIRVQEDLQTMTEGVYAAGDVLGEHMLVYTASYEGELAAANAILGEQRPREYTGLGWVIFTDPQVAGVGMDEEEARQAGFQADTAVLPATRWPRFRTAFETRGFLKLVRDRKTDRLLGARAVVPEAGELANELSLVIRHGITIRELAESFHPYLTLLEGIQRCAQKFEPVAGNEGPT